MATPRLNPPNNALPIADDGQHTQAWAAYHQEVADHIDQALTSIADKAGVVDGSDATAGQLGEYLTATASGVVLTNNVGANVVTLALPAGDWDVTGVVALIPATGTAATHLAAGVGSVSAVFTQRTSLFAAFTVGAGGAQFSLGSGMPVRFSSAAPATAYLVASAAFGAGSMTAGGTIAARRMR